MLIGQQGRWLIFLAAATDDQLGFASHSTEVYNAWVAKGRSAELHLYAAGGHGFGILPNNTPSDLWTVAFEKWLQFKEFIPRDGR